MKDFILMVLVVLSYGLMMALIFTGTGMHRTGYEQGIQHSRLYYEATGEFPTRDWVSAHLGDKLEYSEQILESLEEY